MALPSQSGGGDPGGPLTVSAQPRGDFAALSRSRASGLFEKTVAAYPEPAIPEPVGWAFEAHNCSRGTFSVDSSRCSSSPS